jgi:hypothetical protein
MPPTLLKALGAILTACVLLIASAVMLRREKRVWSVLQLLGAVGLATVVLAHLCEALQILPWMRWRQEHGVGHYLDLSAALVGFALFPLGYLRHAQVVTRDR